MEIQPDFKILNGYAYLFPEFIHLSPYPSLKRKPSLKFYIDWSRLYLIFLILLLVFLVWGLYESYSWGEDILLLPLSILLIWIAFRLYVRWRYSWTQGIEISGIQSLHFYRPIKFGWGKNKTYYDMNLGSTAIWTLFFRPSLILYYKDTLGKKLKRRIRVRNLGIKGIEDLLEARRILFEKYRSLNPDFQKKDLV